MSRDKDYIKLINSTQWQKVRRAKLAREPMCEECRRQGRTRFANQVHHIVPVETGYSYGDKRSLAYDPTNLMSLCEDCHRAIHEAMGKGTAQERRQRAEARSRKVIDALFGSGIDESPSINKC